MKNGHVIDKDGDHVWYKNNQLHRDGAPAVVYTGDASTVEEWYQHNELHRENGPAITYTDGATEWYARNQLHRIGGPAIHGTYPPYVEWYVLGRSVDTWTDYQRLSECSDEELIMLKLKWGEINQ